ncbi:Putative Flavoprotein-like superfamily [Septoria linicola]|uniref:Flavoprotein-like superfamily n=1 Tax=Septoria linicola TaxID=215465 RepID=A0A9Q9EJ87_9PEZI|nr:putative Flavoprotein-like superfamily [Septoria linicola]USW51902.1 Putative Flavoprotein-like superfamily [Septoria linicola]
MHILGVANGSVGGNSEILLKAALKAAQEANRSITTSWVHIPSVTIPPNPQPLEGAADISLGNNPAMTAAHDGADNVEKHGGDDRQALLDAFLDADAYIFSTPIYSHGPAGFLKGVLDRILGPFTDATFVSMVLQKHQEGDPAFLHMKVDERVLKPRVAAFICVGGSTTPDQVSQALPVLHTQIYPMHVKIVDQIVCQDVGRPGAVLARFGGRYVQRAGELGRNVAGEIGKKFDEAVYRGPGSGSACPCCFLDSIEPYYEDNKIGCVACGTKGRLHVDETGTIKPAWDNPCGVSSASWEGKALHIRDIHEQMVAEQMDIDACEQFEERLHYWRAVDTPRVPLTVNTSTPQI